MVTIGVPFYNCENTLLYTLKSIFAQSFQDWELVIIDDGSQDRSLDIVRAVDSSKVRVFSDGLNLGIGARRAQIVQESRGDYLAWQDADDMMHPLRLEKQLQFIKENSEVDLFDTSVYQIDSQNRVVGIVRAIGSDFSIQNQIARPVLINASSFGKIEVYQKHQIDRKLRRVEDWDFWIRASKDYQFAHMATPLFYWRHHDSGGRPLVLKELKEMPHMLKLIRRYGPSAIGWHHTSFYMARYFVRALFRSTLTALHLHKLLKDARDSDITKAEYAEACKGIEHILNTVVPGLE